MTFRRKLLLAFSATVVVVVMAVAWIVSNFTRSAFARINQDRTSATVAQFQREFDRRGDDVAREVGSVAASDSAARIANESASPQPDYGAFLSETRSLADSHRLNYLEFLDSSGKIISSAQWPVKFGYKDASVQLNPAPGPAHLKEEQLPDHSELGLFAVRVTSGEPRLFVAGGRRLDQQFLSSLDLPSGMRALLYQNLSPAFSPALLISASGQFADSEKLAPMIQNVINDRSERTEVMRWTGSRSDDETIYAKPLPGQDGRVLGVLLIGSSLKPYAELNRRMNAVALMVAAGGIFLAIFISNWAAWRFAKPVEELANAASSVAAGDLNVKVNVSSRDELGILAESFNRMTRELLDQRDRLVQAERVAAWRELARRLAHELKNPLFPLQLTVENLTRAHESSPQMFEEIFKESTATLLAEINNLKSTIGRFSEFSRMPQPHFQSVNLNEIARQVIRVFQAQLQAGPKIDCRLGLDDNLVPVAADPDLLHRAISNLVLNAMDAMPKGGTLTLRTYKEDDRVRLEVGDSGTGLNPEECQRLFTPYYTTKQHGTGLGLAIVQSIISDHHGRVRVDSRPGQGTRFILELPQTQDKLSVAAPQSADSVFDNK